jgi:hypothetical protein
MGREWFEHTECGEVERNRTHHRTATYIVNRARPFLDLLSQTPSFTLCAQPTKVQLINGTRSTRHTRALKRIIRPVVLYVFLHDRGIGNMCRSGVQILKRGDHHWSWRLRPSCNVECAFQTSSCRHAQLDTNHLRPTTCSTA